MENLKNIFYFYDINAIGGVETFFYYLARKYSDKDITIYYSTGDEKQIMRLAKYVRVRKFMGEEITCEKAFFNYRTDIIDHVHAKEYAQIIHADYKHLGMKYVVHPKITRLLGVSKHVCNVVKELTGMDCELAYNPVVLEEPKKILRLISATRLTFEKGRNRMLKLASALDRACINYEWQVFTNSYDAIDSENVVFRRPRLDLTDYIATADYLVQLSDAEGYCFSVVEALSLGTPVIVTDLPVYNELGLNKKNSIKLNLEMDNIPVDQIAKGLPEFSYTPPADKWGTILAKGKSTYSEDKRRNVELRVTSTYFDLELDRLVKDGERITTNAVRARMLIEKNLCEEV